MGLRDTDRARAARPSHADDQLAATLGAIADLNDNLQQLHAGVKTTNAIRRLGAEPRLLLGVSQKLSNSPGRLAGVALRETAGAAAVVRVRDGFDANGDLILPIALAANASILEWFLPGGISYTAGLFFEVVSGAVEGCLYTGTSLPG
jgi:hypothetical protein